MMGIFTVLPKSLAFKEPFTERRMVFFSLMLPVLTLYYILQQMLYLITLENANKINGNRLFLFYFCVCILKTRA